MLLLSTLLGFLGPFIPELLKTWNRKQDNAQELAILRLQGDLAKEQASYRRDEISLQGNFDLDKSELVAVHAPVASFGVQVLDAAAHSNLPFWVIWPVFWLFAFMDWLNASVRPVITYWIVGFYTYYKWSILSLGHEGGNDLRATVIANWSENDWAVLMLCLGYFFGQRAAKAAFGGSASTGRAGGG
jgi:hypothetical protein